MDIKFFAKKSFYDYPCAHRQWKHDNHCRFVHGYCRSFDIIFATNKLDKNGFVVDLSDLKEIKEHLRYMYDHTILILKDDPKLEFFKKLDKENVVQLRIVDFCSLEAIAESIFLHSDKIIKEKTNNNSFVYKVIAKENEKNTAIFCPF